MRILFVLLLILAGNKCIALTHYVSASGEHVSPYTNWVDAATNIQDAIDVSENGDEVVVTNGVYATGGAIGYGAGGYYYQTNRIAIYKPITVRSVNGPEYTFIQGAYSERCAYVGNNARLVGFTLCNGQQPDTYYFHGGGAYCESKAIISNCIIRNNQGYLGGGVFGGTIQNCLIVSNRAECHYEGEGGGGTYGAAVENCIIKKNSSRTTAGGSYGGVLKNCIISENTAEAQNLYDLTCNTGGGGTYKSAVYNCTVADNWSGAPGGGTYGSLISNSIVYYNLPDNANASTSRYSCITPGTGGIGTITKNPMFASRAGDKDYHLSSNSPCIDAGAPTSILYDLDNTARPLDGNNDGVAKADLGAYEFVHPEADTDTDGLTDDKEIRAGTNPANSTSVFAITSVDKMATFSVIKWKTVFGKGYWVQKTQKLDSGSWSNICSSPVYELNDYPAGTESITDLNEDTNCSVYYRIILE